MLQASLSLQQGCQPRSEPLPQGLPEAGPLEIYPEKGRNLSLFPIPRAVSLLRCCTGGGCSPTLDKGAMASPCRTASKDSKGIPEGNIRSITARARLQSGSRVVPRHSSWGFGTWAALGLSAGLEVPMPKGMGGWKWRIIQGMDTWTNIFGCRGRTGGNPVWFQCIPCEHPSPRLWPNKVNKQRTLTQVTSLFQTEI